MTWRERSQPASYSSLSDGQALHARSHGILSVCRRQILEEWARSVGATHRNWLTCALSSSSHEIPSSIRQWQLCSKLTRARRWPAGGGTLRIDRSACEALNRRHAGWPRANPLHHSFSHIAKNCMSHSRASCSGNVSDARKVSGRTRRRTIEVAPGHSARSRPHGKDVGDDAPGSCQGQ